MQLDEFESRFKRAAKKVFEIHDVTYRNVLVVTDLSEQAAADFAEKLKVFRGIADDATWTILDQSSFPGVVRILSTLDQVKPDLIISYRNLNYADKRQAYTLGVYIDVLTQATPVPVLLVPSPDEDDFDDLIRFTDQVMVITDHLQGDYRLVDSALPFAVPDGRLTMLDVEDELDFQRTVAAIEKIPDIDSDTARELLRAELLREPNEYVTAASTALAERHPGLTVEGVVQLGHPLSVARDYVDRNKVGLIVLNTKDATQLAMHGEAYAMTVELRRTPLLLL